ncbi:hypothetical protein PMAYCL1PPCAC_30072, partial [Pristionchus mayeri]
FYSFSFFLSISTVKMRRILGERNQNVVGTKKNESDLEEWKAIHEVNRAEIGSNGSFLEFGEEAFDCLDAGNEENELPIEVEVPATIDGVPSEVESSSDVTDSESIFSEDQPVPETHQEDSPILKEVSNQESFENDESEAEIEFSVPSSSTPLPSAPEVLVLAPPSLFSIEYSREKISFTVGTRALWRALKWSIVPSLFAASYFSCPYLQYRVHKFIMEF